MKLVEIREKLGFSQKQMADALGKSYQRIQQYEQGAAVPKDVMDRALALLERQLPDNPLEAASIDPNETSKNELSASKQSGINGEPSHTKMPEPLMPADLIRQLTETLSKQQIALERISGDLREQTTAVNHLIHLIVHGKPQIVNISKRRPK